MADSKTVLILGGGVGGLVAASNLRKLLPKQHRIVVIDQEQEHLFAPSLLWLMIGKRQKAQIIRSLDGLTRKGIEFIHGKVEAIAAETKTVRVLGREISGDAMIVSLGADLAPEAIPGLAEAGRNIYTLSGAEAIYRDLASFTGGRVVVLTAAPAYKCPAAPYETAMLVEDYFRKHGIREKTIIEVYAAEAGPMLTAGLELSAAVRQMVEAKGIAYHPSHQVTTVDPKTRRITFANGASAAFDLLFYVPPHKAPAVVKAAGLVSESGWIPVDRHTLETKFKGVYAIGDVTVIPLAMGRPLPKAGVFAHGEAEVVAHNIAQEWTGFGEGKSFNGFGECFIEIGDHRAGMGRGDFYGEPVPRIEMKRPSVWWHVAKILFEKHWFWKWF